MNRNNLLNKLTDEIDIIDNLAYQAGESKTFIKFSKFDKSLALHKTRALQIIEKLR